MANQNFRVKKGLEVGTGSTFLYADDTGVGINSSTPRYNLDVQGTANIKDGVIIGEPSNVIVGLGSTVFQVNGSGYVDGDLFITGDINFDDANVENLNVTGIATINELNFNVGVGSTLTVGVLSVTEDITVNGGGIATLGGDPEFNTLTVLGISTFGGLSTTGVSTFYQNLDVEGNLTVGGNIELADLDAGNITIGGTMTSNGLVFNVGIGTTLTVGVLSVTDTLTLGGVGVATLGGDPEFNTLSVLGFSTFGGANTTGFSTFYQNLEVTEDLKVGGNIELADLDAGNITIGGTITSNGLVFNVGIGTTLTVGVLSVTEDIQVNGSGVATIGGDPVFNTLSVLGFSTFGGANTTGFSTFYDNLEVKNDLKVGGNIELADLDAGNITIGGTVTSNGLNFNVGIGTTLQLEDLIVTGISSLNIITGIGSELQYLPAGSISTSVGVGSTQPPTLRPTGEPVQAGDLWFDAEGLRQYTYFIQAGVQTGIWLDSNPPPIQPDLRFEGDFGPVSQFSLQDDIFNIAGTQDQVITRIPIAGFGRTISVGLDTNVTIEGDFVAAGLVSATDADFSGIGTFGTINAANADIDTINIGDITVDFVTVGEIGINTITFNEGIGTSLVVDDLTVNGNANINGSGIATLGGEATFNSLTVSGLTTLGAVGPAGVTTVIGDLYVGGDLFVGDDITFDDATVDTLTAREKVTTDNLEFNVGIGTTLTLNQNLSVGSTMSVGSDADFGGTVDIEGALTVNNAALTSLTGNLDVGGDLDVIGDIDGDEITGRRITSTENLSFTNASGSGTLGVATVNVGDRLSASRVSISSDLTVTTEGVVSIGSAFTVESTGIGSFIGDLQFKNGVGYALTVQRFRVPPDGFVDLPGIPVVGGAASFSQLIVTGIASFTGFTTITGDVAVSGAMTVGSLTASEINFSGGTGIGTTSITTNILDVRERADIVDLYVSGISSFTGLATFQNVSIAQSLTSKQFYVEELFFGGGGSIGRDFIDVENIRVSGVATIGFTSTRDLRVSGGSTFVGVGTFENDLYVSQDLYVEDEIFSQNLSVSNNANIGVVSVGFLTATNAQIAGIITAQDFNTLSDRRVKENIETIKEPLDKISKIRGVDFTFINSGKKSTGIIAQEVEQVFPHLISGSFPKSVNYNGLIGLLVESVKELKEENQNLKRRIEKLEN